MIHTAFFYIPVIFAFNSPHFINSYMHHTGKKRKKKEKKRLQKNLLQGDWNPPNQLTLTN